VGGLYREQGLDVVRKWLHSLLLSDIEEAYESVQSDADLKSCESVCDSDLSSLGLQHISKYAF
jgi:hypothetical protein